MISNWLLAAKPQNTLFQEKMHQISVELMKRMGFTGKVAETYAPLFQWGIRIALAILIFLVFAFLARKARIRRIIGWIDEKIGAIELTSADRNFIAFLIWGVIWLIGILLMLYVLKLTGLLATVGLSAGTITAIAAVANKELLGNVFAGFVLQSRRQIGPGDAIKAVGLSGSLLRIGLTSCEVQDFDGATHFIPNSKLLNETLTNYSLATFRRADLTFWYETEAVYTSEIEELIESVIDEAPGQCEDKPGFFRYGEFNEKGQQVTISLYMDAKHVDGSSYNISQARRILRENIEHAEIDLGIPRQVIIDAEFEDAPS